MAETSTPVLMGLVQDVMFAVRIEESARALGYRVVWLAPGDDIVARMVAEQPALCVVDIADAQSGWALHIARAKASPATRRIPILAFGAHVDVVTFERARLSGANEVLGRGAFVNGLAGLIEKHSRFMRPEAWAALERDCAAPLPADALRGLEEFNRGEYYQAHETLEHVWQAESAAVRDLYRVVLQIAVAYYHVERRNWEGALKMFARSQQWFNRLPERCRGIELAQLRADAEVVEAAVRRAVEAGVDGAVARELLRPVVYA